VVDSAIEDFRDFAVGGPNDAWPPNYLVPEAVRNPTNVFFGCTFDRRTIGILGPNQEVAIGNRKREAMPEPQEWETTVRPAMSKAGKVNGAMIVREEFS
jgi:hypothetical protein